MNTNHDKKNIILACLISGVYDVNRNEILDNNDFTVIENWYNSIISNGLEGVIFHNGLSEKIIKKYQNNNILFKKIDISTLYSPNVYRYFLYQDFLQKNKTEIESIFITDISDVTIGKNPFTDSTFISNPEKIFCGDEPKTLDNEWMHNHSTHFRNNIPEYLVHEEKHRDLPLLNCGIIGGRTDTMIELLKILCEIHQQYNQHNTSAYTGDMGAFNYIMRTRFASRIIHGEPVNTVFKSYENERTDCWFRHK